MKKFYTIFAMVILVFIVGCNVNENHAESTESISQGGVQRVNVIAAFDGGEFADKMDLLIEEINTYKEGTLYELKLNYNKDFYGRYDSHGGDKWEGEWDRLHLGYFFIKGDNVYRVRETEADGIESWNVQDIMANGKIICQEEPMEDTLGEEEKGFHEKIIANGNRREYHSYENWGETNFFEDITFEIGKGLVEYRCGYGALRDYLSITVSENIGMSDEDIAEQEMEYHAFLQRDQEAFYEDSEGVLTSAYLSQIPGFEGMDINKNCLYRYDDYNEDGLEELIILNNKNMRYAVVKYDKEALKVIEYGEFEEDDLIWDYDWRHNSIGIETLKNTIKDQETELQNINSREETPDQEDTDDIWEETMEAYGEFLDGERETDTGLSLDDIIIPTGEPEKCYSSRYTFYDVNGDEIPELHVWSAKYYYILSYKNNELYTWTSLYSLTTLFNDGTFLYAHTSMGSENYIYYEFDSQGNQAVRINFSRWDKNHDNQFGEEDAYYYGSKGLEISKEEWDVLVGKYLSKEKDEIEWITICDSTS